MLAPLFRQSSTRRRLLRLRAAPFLLVTQIEFEWWIIVLRPSIWVVSAVPQMECDQRERVSWMVLTITWHWLTIINVAGDNGKRIIDSRDVTVSKHSYIYHRFSEYRTRKRCLKCFLRMIDVTSCEHFECWQRRWKSLFVEKAVDWCRTTVSDTLFTSVYLWPFPRRNTLTLFMSSPIVCSVKTHWRNWLVPMLPFSVGAQGY